MCGQGCRLVVRVTRFDRQSPGLRTVVRDPALLGLLVAETVSTTGSQMTALALPWFVLITTGSAKQMSFVVASEIAAYVLAGIPSGGVIGRFGSRRTMLICDAVRAPLMLLIPILHWSGSLRFWELLVVAFVLGVAGAPYGGAQRVLTAELLSDNSARVGQANALFQGATRVTLVLGPPLAGVLIGVAGAVTVLVIDAVSFATAFVLVSLFVPKPSLDITTEGSAPKLLDGLRYLRKDRVLAALSVAISVGDAAFQVIFIGLTVLVVSHYNANPRLVGVFFAAWGGAAVLGNIVAYRRFKNGIGPRSIAFLVCIQALPLIAVALPIPAVAVAAGLSLSGLANGLVNPTIHSLITLRPPPTVRPHVVTAIFTASAVGAPLALVLAGPAFQTLGSRLVLGIAVGFQITAMVCLAIATLRLTDSFAPQRTESDKRNSNREADRADGT